MDVYYENEPHTQTESALIAGVSGREELGETVVTANIFFLPGVAITWKF